MKLNDRDFDELEVEDLETVRKRVERSRERKARKRNKGFFSRHPSLIPVIIVLILLTITGAVFLSKYSGDIMKLSPNADLSERFGGLKDDEAGIILNDEYETEVKALTRDGEVYLPYDFVKDELNDWFYRNEDEGVVLYTTPEGTDRYDEGGEAKTIGGVFCLSSELIKKYTDFEYSEFLKGDTPYVLIRNETGKYDVASLSEKTGIFVSGDKDSDILAVAEKGKKLRVLESGNEWTKVQDKDGLIGYIVSKSIDEYSEVEDDAKSGPKDMEFPCRTFNGRVVLGWHQVFNTTANEGIHDILANNSVINVLSPTWFFISNSEGGFSDNSSIDYVNAAHAAGKQVWPVVDNFNNREFKSREGTVLLLSSTENRRRLIEGLISALGACGADGLNVDFEGVSVEAGEDYSQFIKELSVACHDAGFVLSVDNYVPEAHSLHYDRKAQGKVCDFCVIMGYDEYNAASGEAGPVASIDFVEKGIQDTMEFVDHSKIINGLPLYSRIFETKNGNVLSTQALEMEKAANAFSSRGVEVTWDDSVGCNYGEYEENGSLWRMWLEDRDSLRVKLSVMQRYDLAGAAFWKLGLEDEPIWEDVSAYAAGEEISPVLDEDGS